MRNITTECHFADWCSSKSDRFLAVPLTIKLAFGETSLGLPLASALSPPAVCGCLLSHIHTKLTTAILTLYKLQVRQVIVDELTDNARQYATVTEECGVGAADYVNESGMANEGVWGSDVEIIVAATLMCTPIAVYSAYGDRQYLWQVFEPVPTTSRDDSAAVAAVGGPPSSHTCMIYLQNTNKTPTIILNQSLTFDIVGILFAIMKIDDKLIRHISICNS